VLQGTPQLRKHPVVFLEIFCSKKIKYTMEINPKRNIYYTFCHFFFFLGLFSHSISDFFRKKKSNNAILFIYFRGYC
jgi:hypothetical protein